MRRFAFEVAIAGAWAVLGCGSDEGASHEPPLLALDGTQAEFDLGADLSQPASFYALPWPSDLRITATGSPDLAGFPNPSAKALVEGLRAIAMDRPGFPVTPMGYFHFSAELAPRDLTVYPADTSSPVLLIDIDPDSPERGKLWPTIAPTVQPDGGYVPEHLLAVAPLPGLVLTAGRSYGFVVLRSLGDASGAPLGVPLALRQLAHGRRPEGARGEAAAALYGPLFDTLASAGIAADDVAAATVFTTGDVVASSAALASAVTEAFDAPIADLHVDPSDGATHERFCEVLGTITYPEFQVGTPPFNADGSFAFGGDGLPVKQRDETVPLTITLPKTPMPAGGYPLVLYFHGSGGLSSAAVDMGRGTTPDGENPVPGTGPAHYLSHRGFATAAAALPVNPERLPGAPETAYLNFLNLAAFRDTFRQGLLEMHLLAEALGALRIDPASVAACALPGLPSGETAYRVRTETLFAQGQSMGGMYTNLVAATHPRITAAVPTGAGGFWSYFVPTTPLVPGLDVIAGTIVGVPLKGYAATLPHPALMLLETAWEPAEPLVYATRLAQRPLPGHPVRPVYEPVAKGDSYFPANIYDAMVVSYRHRQAGDLVWTTMQDSLAWVGLDGLLSYPVSNDATAEDGTPYTGVVVQYEADGAYDPHSIYRQLDAVKYQYGCFFESFRDTGTAVVPAPADVDSACPR